MEIVLLFGLYKCVISWVNVVLLDLVVLMIFSMDFVFIVKVIFFSVGCVFFG